MSAGLRLRPFGETDWWWHVMAGEAVRASASRAVPEFAAFHGPATYNDPEWGFDVLAAVLMSAGGTAAAVGLTMVCAALSAVFIGLLSVELGAHPRLAVFTTALAAMASNWHFTARPQSVQLVLTPLVLWLAARVASRAGRARWAALAALHLVLAAWAQVHTSVVVAPVMVWLVAAVGVAELGAAAAVALASLAVWPLLRGELVDGHLIRLIDGPRSVWCGAHHHAGGHHREWRGDATLDAGVRSWAA